MKFIAASAFVGLAAGRSMYSLNEDHGNGKGAQMEQIDFSNWDMEMFNHMGEMGGGNAHMQQIPGFDQWKANKEYYMMQMQQQMGNGNMGQGQHGYPQPMDGGNAHMSNWMEQVDAQNFMDWMKPEPEADCDDHDHHERPHNDHNEKPHDDHHERPHDDDHKKPHDDHHERPHDRPDDKPHGKPDGKPDDKPHERPDDKPDHRPDNRPDGHHPNEDDCEEWESDDEDDEGDNVVITHIDNRFLYVAPIINRNNIVISNVNHDNNMIESNNAMVNMDASMMKKMMWMKKMKHMKQMKEEGKIDEGKMHHFLEHAKEYLDHKEMDDYMDNMDNHHYDEEDHDDHHYDDMEEDDGEFTEFEDDPFFDEDFFEIEW